MRDLRGTPARSESAEEPPDPINLDSTRLFRTLAAQG